MAYFDPKHGIVGKPEQWETPYFVKDFFSFIVGQPQVQQPKPRKTNILSK
jgi:hypothetical protein